jgi:hypothetical protein
MRIENLSKEVDMSAVQGGAVNSGLLGGLLQGGAIGGGVIGIGYLAINAPVLVQNAVDTTAITDVINQDLQAIASLGTQGYIR